MLNNIIYGQRVVYFSTFVSFEMRLMANKTTIYDIGD